jgi:hypothetical protein
VRQGDAEVAAAGGEVAGIDFEPAGGNNASVDLELFPLEADTGASFIAVRSTRQEGDEWMKASGELQLFAVKGDDLVEVFAEQVYSLDEPGPGGPGRREELETGVEPGKKRTGGMRNLIATQRSVGSGRTRAVVTFVWDGARYVDKKTLAPPAPDAGPAR